MIRVSRRFGVPETGFGLDQTELRSGSLMVVRQRMTRTMLSERLYGCSSKREERWPNIRLVLAGRVILDAPAGQRELGPGDLVVSHDWGAAPFRTISEDVDMVLVAWRETSRSPGVGPVNGRCTPTLWHAARQLVDAMTEQPSSVPLGAVLSVVDALVAEGLLESRDDVGAPSALLLPAALRRFGSALGELQSRNEARLMAVDMADLLGCSERNALRLASSYFRTLHVTVDSWREYAAGARLASAVLAMASRGARTEVVSARLGFSSPVALCHAFAAAGLPSPGRLRDALVAS